MFTTLPSSLGYVPSFVLIRVTKYRVVSASSYLRDRNIDRRSPRDSIYNFQGKMAKNTSIDIRKEIINKEEEKKAKDYRPIENQRIRPFSSISRTREVVQSKIDSVDNIVATSGGKKGFPVRKEKVIRRQRGRKLERNGTRFAVDALQWGGIDAGKGATGKFHDARRRDSRGNVEFFEGTKSL